MAKKPTIKKAPRVKIPVDRQTPDQTFAPREQPPVTRLPPPPSPPEPDKQTTEEDEA